METIWVATFVDRSCSSRIDIPVFFEQDVWSFNDNNEFIFINYGRC